MLLFRRAGEGAASHGDHVDGQGTELSSEQRVTVSWFGCGTLLLSSVVISGPLAKCARSPLSSMNNN